MKSLVLSILAMSAVLFAPEYARADDGAGTDDEGGTRGTIEPRVKRFGWDPAWRRFDAAEYTLTGVVALSAASLHAFANPNRVNPFGGPILFDEPVRDAFRAKGRDDLVRARSIGNVMNVATLGQVLLVDSVIIPLARGSGDLAWQMTWMNAEAFGTSGLATWLLFALVGRGRPSYRECQAGTTDDPLCGAGISSSFPSGHTAGAFTAAGLTCAHHESIPLYGGGAPDVIACIGALVVGTGGGVMRIIGDRHYVSDVIAGAAIGFGAGYLMPTFLHYRAGPRKEDASSAKKGPFRIGWSLGSVGAPLGASAFGMF